MRMAFHGTGAVVLLGSNWPISFLIYCFSASDMNGWVLGSLVQKIYWNTIDGGMNHEARPPLKAHSTSTK